MRSVRSHSAREGEFDQAGRVLFVGGEQDDRVAWDLGAVKRSGAQPSHQLDKPADRSQVEVDGWSLPEIRERREGHHGRPAGRPRLA